MIEDLYKKFCFIFIIINLYLISSTLNNNDFIFIDYIPYQESQRSLGLYFYNNEDFSHLFSFQNWFSNNLFIGGLLYPYKNRIDLDIKYNIIHTHNAKTCIRIF